MPSAKKLIGARIGRLTVISLHGRDKFHRRVWLCRCACGTERMIATGQLRKTRSCGCLHRELLGNRVRVHGMTGTREHNSWRHILSRCYNPKNRHYSRYGARGIGVCAEWRESFQRFYQDMGPCPADHSIDRINNDGNYEPGNCRWATVQEQNRNRSERRWLTAFGITLRNYQWTEISGLDKHIFYQRVTVSGWIPELAVTLPKGATKNGGAYKQARMLLERIQDLESGRCARPTFGD